MGIEGKIKCYWNDSLRGIITVKEIKDRTSIRVNIQHQNPDNPEDPYDLIDTVITQDFNPDSINTIRVYFEWENKGLESRLKIYSIAPMFNPVIAGIELPLTTIFLIKASDYLKTLDKNEKAFWSYFYTFMLKNRSSGGVFEWYTEDNLPNGN